MSARSQVVPRQDITYTIKRYTVVIPTKKATATAPVLRLGPVAFSDVTGPENTLIIMDIITDIIMHRLILRRRPPVIISLTSLMRVNITIPPATAHHLPAIAADTTEGITADTTEDITADITDITD